MLVMDPQSATFTPQNDFWRIQNDMLRVQQTQADHAERLARLERRQEEDARVKSVWGTSSPFPSGLTGTPQQTPLSHTPADAFSGFDDQHNNLIGSLQLDADEEPRRTGATSRANSVRFDESANQGHWAHASRSSVDLIPRTGSGLGGHPMIERSFSHKSDGRQSSTGHSVHSATSGRANSLGLDTAFSLGQAQSTPIEPPGLAPGLFILGSVPAIIRCWLNTTFKHDSLLYAAVCSGSYTSFLDKRLIDRLSYQDQIYSDSYDTRKIKLAVYLPEAIPQLASSRSNSPAPQLPALTVDFTVVERDDDMANSRAIQIFLGSDMLRAHNADILFSSNTITLFDDDRSKLSIPMVRPEDERTFKSLYVTSAPPEKDANTSDTKVVSTAAHEAVLEQPSPSRPEKLLSSCLSFTARNPSANGSDTDRSQNAPPSEDSAIEPSGSRRSLEQRPLVGLISTKTENKNALDGGTTTNSAKSSSSPAIWSSWRRESDKGSSLDSVSAGKLPSTGYQRKDTGIKVLKPTRSSSRAFSSVTGQSGSPVTGQSRFFDDGRRRTSTPSEVPESLMKRTTSTTSTDTKPPTTTKENLVSTKPRSANPVGGASAFAWLNSSGQFK